MLSRTAISGHGPVAVAESLERMFHSVRHTRATPRTQHRIGVHDRADDHARVPAHLRSLIRARGLGRAAVAGVLLASAAACAAPATAVADRVAVPQGMPGFEMPTPREQARVPERRARRASLPASASSAVVPESCPPEAEGAVCGHVVVPFDRADPGAGTIPIAFELYPHSGPGPAESATMFNFGGPGVSTTALRGVAPFFVGPALERHDVLLVDDRGRGRSGAIDCPDYQHGAGPSLLAMVAGCAEQLGPHAVHYSTAEIAHDNEAVRAALGYEAVDFVATSYGGVDAAAYATRFGSRLRSIVLSGPWGEPFFEPFDLAAVRVRHLVERVGLLCERSRSCGRSAQQAVAEAAWLVRRVRRAPVEGTALDAAGESHDVTVDAGSVLGILDAVDFFLTPGEIPAAAEALRHGDAVPLLRLAADADFPIPGDSGDPAFFSQGANAATGCVEQPWPWSPDASLPVRQAQWAGAVSAAADQPFAPFSAEEVMFSLLGGADFCLPWPATGSRPHVEPGARYPKVPTLVLSGELDFDAAMQRKVAALYPRAKLVTFTGTGHTPMEWSQCARDLAVGFLQTRRLGDTRCASDSTFDYPVVASFPRLAHQSAPAAGTHGNRAGRSARRVARVATDTTLDALKRSLLSFSENGPGLRGGTRHTDYAEAFTTTLNGAQCPRTSPSAARCTGPSTADRSTPTSRSKAPAATTAHCTCRAAG